MKKIISFFFILVAGLQFNVNCSLARPANQVTVTDVCGNKTSMKKLNLNLKKKYANFSYDDIARGAVASDGNFYFLKKEKKGIYKIYKNGKVCKTFKDKEAEIDNMVRMDNRYYALGYFYDGWFQLVKLEDEKSKFETLKTNFAVQVVYREPYWKFGYPSIYVWNHKFMSIHLDYNGAAYWAIMAKDGRSLYTGEHVNFTVQMSRNRVFVTRVNNTMYYGITHGKTVKIYKFNIKSRKESLIVEYKRKKKSNDDTRINFDKNYMFYQGDIIPLKGGKIISVSKKNKTAFSSNKKNIYYIDKKRRLHKINKKTLKDTIAAKMKVRDVYATEHGVFFRKYDKDLEEAMLADDYGDMNWHKYFPRHIYKLTKNGKAKVILK